ncbi:MAG: single-stranded-DNA-specific exonuclease RecJ [Bacteroidales bacterium]|nr:single-stranded-DNA-specific exonuclease RecJ [Bacteroidales bacterium]
MDKQWIVREVGDIEKVNHLVEVLSVDIVTANLLAHRGISTYEEAKSFFRPDLNNLHDPFLMKDMDLAIARIKQAISRNEKIMIYGDYDVDGTTAVALLISFFRKHYDRLIYYIPDRYNEGYGVSYKGIDFAGENDVSLIIALDCGIKAVEKVAYANEKKIDFIICDHHTPGDVLPPAVAVLNPKRSDCYYPYKDLSGCGVGFKLIHAYCLENQIELTEIYEYLDLVSVSIASDIVPITGENRTISYFGLEKLNKDPILGLRAIINVAGCDDSIMEINDVVFKIGPRINAAGRIETGRTAVDLLITEDEVRAMEIAAEINSINNERKELDHNITEEALSMIENSEEMLNRKSTVLFNPNWHKGVIGIVASRVIEKYYRPSIILTENNGLLTGSARSVHDFDLYKAVDACSEYLEGFGGHMYAAGLTMKKENLEAFSAKFEEFVSKNIRVDQLCPVINVDAEIKLSDITPKFYRLLEQFQPFGPENMRPVFASHGVRDSGESRAVGKEHEHLKLDITDETGGKHYSGIAFRMGNEIARVRNATAGFSVCYTIDENVFNGRVNLQLMVKDLKF